MGLGGFYLKGDITGLIAAGNRRIRLKCKREDVYNDFGLPMIRSLGILPCCSLNLRPFEMQLAGAYVGMSCPCPLKSFQYGPFILSEC